MREVAVQCRRRNGSVQHRLRWRLSVEMRRGGLAIIDAGAPRLRRNQTGIERRYARRPRESGGR
jgi:hypothetical protein